MKEYSISKLAFYGILLLILTLPVSRHWRLLSFGERAEGTVGLFILKEREMLKEDRVLVYASEVRFTAGDSTVLTYGPDDFGFKQGRKVPVRYDPRDPSRNMVVTFAGFYLTYYTVLIVVLWIIWLAFYHSFNNYQKNRRGGTSVPASSPYRTAQKRRPQSLNKKLGK